MPFSRKQQKLFHAAENDPEIAEEHGMSRREAGKLADEADRLAREGRTKPAKKADEPAAAAAAAAAPASAPAPGFIDLHPTFAGR